MLKRNPWGILCLLTVCHAHGGAFFTNLYSFTGGSDGGRPLSGLVQGTDENLYGSTTFGGTNKMNEYGRVGFGTIFKITTSGAITPLVILDDVNVPMPGTMVQGRDGYFYGTTGWGGSNTLGTIFRMSSNGVFTTMITFDGTNGAHPAGGFLQATDGVFYGVTTEGGTNNFPAHGRGTVFAMTTNGVIANLFQFSFTNGSGPVALLQSSDGALYGTTRFGNNSGDASIFGTVFKITTTGMFTSLAAFRGTNGLEPGPLVQSQDGNFYGTTANGGLGNSGDNFDFSGLGTVFRMGTNGDLSSLVLFNGTNGANGGQENGGIVEGKDGNFYGTTIGGGAYDNGTVFRLTSAGIMTTLFEFNGTNGSQPISLLQATDGNFYGVATFGGAYGQGTVFRLSVPMAPILQVPAMTNNSLALTWSAVAGQTYQLQFNSDLNSTNWNNLGSANIATNGTMSASDLIGPEAQRFYRVVLQP